MRAVGFYLILTTITLWLYSSHLSAGNKEGAYLQAMLSFSQADVKMEKIFPRSLINLKAKIKNIGNVSNAPGAIYVRFAFLEPLHTQQGSLLFQSEKEPLPSIKSGEEVEIAFKINHQWPSFFDYIREDWPMRQFEAVAVIEGKEEVIGTLTVAISAHYYQGPGDEISRQVPAYRP